MTTKIEERLLSNLSTQECAWMLGRKLGMAAIEAGQSATPRAAHLNEARFCAERLSVTIPPLPIRLGDANKDGQRALVYLLRSAGGAIADTLAKEHGKTTRALFELGLKLQILYWIYQPRFDMALALCEAIERAVGEAELPTPLWSGLIEKARTAEASVAVERVRAEIRSMERAVWAHLLPGQSSGAGAAVTGSRRRRAWDLGYHLATALVAQAQGEPPEVVRPSFQRAEALAVDLGTRLPALPAYEPRHPRRGSADAVSYLLRDAGTRLIAHLRSTHGTAHAALFEISAKSILLRWLYAPGDDLSLSLMRIITNNASEGGILTRIWYEFANRVLAKAPANEVKALLDRSMTESVKHITDKSKGSITVGDRQSLTLPFQKEGAGLRVQTTFNGRLTAPMLYDTGASITVIDRAHAQRLGISTASAWPLQVNTANGLTRWLVVEIDSIEVGGARVEGPFELAISEIPIAPNIAGLLGLNFIRSFISMVDYERNTVTFRAR